MLLKMALVTADEFLTLIKPVIWWVSEVLSSEFKMKEKISEICSLGTKCL